MHNYLQEDTNPSGMLVLIETFFTVNGMHAGTTIIRLLLLL